MLPFPGHPLAGVWTVNLAKSRRHENHQFRRNTIRFEVDGDAVVLSYAGVNMSGKHEAGAMTLHADGVAYPIPQAPGIVSICRWVDNHTLETIGKKDGGVVGYGTYAVSADGLVMTATLRGTDAQGAAFEQVIVFDRKAGDE